MNIRHLLMHYVLADKDDLDVHRGGRVEHIGPRMLKVGGRPRGDLWTSLHCGCCERGHEASQSQKRGCRRQGLTKADDWLWPPLRQQPEIAGEKMQTDL